MTDHPSSSPSDKTNNNNPYIPPDALAVTVNEFCHINRIGRTTFYSEVKAGRIHLKKIGAKTLVPIRELYSWLERQPDAAALNEESHPILAKNWPTPTREEILAQIENDLAKLRVGGKVGA